MKMTRYLLFTFLGLALSAHVAFAAGSSLVPSGPKTVSVGQTFTVIMAVQNATDADTIRLNGTFSPDLLRWVSATPRGTLNVSPGTSLNQAIGAFSYGVFSLGKTLSGNVSVVTMTFTALKPGTATIQLSPTSRVLSAGVDQLVSQGSLSIRIIPKTAAEIATEGAQIGFMSATHPDENAWYQSRDVTVSWDAEALSGYRVTVGYDQSPQGPAEQLVTGGTWSFTVPSDGVWYVHFRAVSPSGAIITRDFRIQIDSTPPRMVVPVTEQDNVPSSFPNSLIFGAIDDTSGIAYYDIFIDGAFVASTTANQWPLPTLSVGQHTFKIVAYDRAGNSTSGSGHVTIAAPTVGFVSVPLVKTFWATIIGGVGGFILAMIAFWFCWGRRKRKK